MCAFYLYAKKATPGSTSIALLLLEARMRNMHLCAAMRINIYNVMRNRRNSDCECYFRAPLSLSPVSTTNNCDGTVVMYMMQMRNNKAQRWLHYYRALGAVHQEIKKTQIRGDRNRRQVVKQKVRREYLAFPRLSLLCLEIGPGVLSTRRGAWWRRKQHASSNSEQWKKLNVVRRRFALCAQHDERQTGYSNDAFSMRNQSRHQRRHYSMHQTRALLAY